MVVSSRDDDSSHYDNAAPWDPIWEYVFGEGGGDQTAQCSQTGASSIRRGSGTTSNSKKADDRSETTDSFLDYIFPSETTDKKKSSKYSSRSSRQEVQSGSPFWGNASGKSNRSGSLVAPVTSFEIFGGDDRNEASSARSGGRYGNNGGGGGGGFWRRNGSGSGNSKKSNKKQEKSSVFSSNDDDDSILSFLDQPYEIDEREYEKQQRKTARRQRKKQQKKNRMFAQRQKKKKKNQDDQSWLSALSASFDDDFTKSQWQPPPSKQQKKRRLFGFGRNRQQQTKNEQKSMFGDSWTGVKQRAENEAAASRGDTEPQPVFSFEKFADAIDSYIDDSSSDYDERSDGEDNSTSTSYTFSDDEEASYATGTASYRSEGTGSLVTAGTEDDGSISHASYSLGSASYQSSRAGSVVRINPEHEPSSEARLRHNPNGGGPLSTILEDDGSYDPEMAAYDSASQDNHSSVRGESFDDASSKASSKMSKPLPRTLPRSPTSEKSPVSNLSMDDGSMISRSYLLPPNGLGKVACCRLKDLGEEELVLARETGIPVHELTKEERETLFPKLRSISEDPTVARSRSMVIGNSTSFERDFPAHLQAIVAENGPQALYEYEYERGFHKVLVYERFGNDPRSLMRVISTHEPLQLVDVDNTKVIVQVEVSRNRPAE